MKLRHVIHPLLMIGVLALALSAYAAWYGKVGEESANAVALAQKIEEAKQQGSQARAAKEELARASANEAAITGYFVDTKDVVPFLETLQSTGTRLNSKVEVVSVSSEPAKPHARLLLSLRITGSFDSVMRTLGTIEYQPYDTTIQSLTLDTPPGEASMWTAAVTLSVGTRDTVASTTP